MISFENRWTKDAAACDAVLNKGGIKTGQRLSESDVQGMLQLAEQEKQQAAWVNAYVKAADKVLDARTKILELWTSLRKSGLTFAHAQHQSDAAATIAYKDHQGKSKVLDTATSHKLRQLEAATGYQLSQINLQHGGRMKELQARHQSKTQVIQQRQADVLAYIQQQTAKDLSKLQGTAYIDVEL